LCSIIAFIIALAYPISSRMHEQIRQEIAHRQTGVPVTDPLRPAHTVA
jgi:Na+/melibiose symporter-like transporter